MEKSKADKELAELKQSHEALKAGNEALQSNADSLALEKEELTVSHYIPAT